MFKTGSGSGSEDVDDAYNDGAEGPSLTSLFSAAIAQEAGGQSSQTLGFVKRTPTTSMLQKKRPSAAAAAAVAAGQYVLPHSSTGPLPAAGGGPGPNEKKPASWVGQAPERPTRINAYSTLLSKLEALLEGQIRLEASLTKVSDEQQAQKLRTEAEIQAQVRAWVSTHPQTPRSTAHSIARDFDPTPNLPPLVYSLSSRHRLPTAQPTLGADSRLPTGLTASFPAAPVPLNADWSRTSESSQQQRLQQKHLQEEEEEGEQEKAHISAVAPTSQPQVASQFSSSSSNWTAAEDPSALPGEAGYVKATMLTHAAFHHTNNSAGSAHSEGHTFNGSDPPSSSLDSSMQGKPWKAATGFPFGSNSGPTGNSITPGSWQANMVSSPTQAHHPVAHPTGSSVQNGQSQTLDERNTSRHSSNQIVIGWGRVRMERQQTTCSVGVSVQSSLAYEGKRMASGNTDRDKESLVVYLGQQFLPNWIQRRFFKHTNDLKRSDLAQQEADEPLDQEAEQRLELAGWVLPESWPQSLKRRAFSSNVQELWEDELHQGSMEHTIDRMNNFFFGRESDDDDVLLLDKHILSQTWTQLGASDAHLKALPKACSTVIDPHGAVRVLFDQCSCLCLLYDVVTLPIFMVWDVHILWMDIMSIAILFFWVADLVINFRTGYYRHGHLVMNPRKIAWHYLKGHFILDLMLVVSNAFAIFLTSAANSLDPGIFNLLRVAKFSRILRIVGVLRLMKVTDLLRKFADRHLGSEYQALFGVPGLLLSILAINHLMGCLWFAVGTQAPSDTGARWVTVPSKEIIYDEQSFGFQYLTAFHWSLSQMTPGSMDVQAYNSCERLYSVACLLVGMIFFSSIISGVSTRLMAYRTLSQRKNNHLSELSAWLRRQRIRTPLAIAAIMQARERILIEEKRTESAKQVLRLLPHKLQILLYYEMCKPHLRHPLLRWWETMEGSAVKMACWECVQMVTLNKQDTLFHASADSLGTCIMISGNLTYTQSPESSKVLRRTRCNVPEDCWLAESALFCHWTHVGTAEASARTEVMAVNADELVTAIQKFTLSCQVFREYSFAFHARVASAKPPSLPFPSDLYVPFGSFEEILPSLTKPVRELIGMAAIQHMLRQKTMMAGIQFVRSLNPPSRFASDLRKEIQRGKSVVMLTGNLTVERFVVVVAVRLVRSDGRFLVQLGRIESQCVIVDVKLPGSKQQEGVMPQQVVQRTMESWLRPFADVVSAPEMVTSERFSKMGARGVKTTYMRTIHEVRLVPTFDGGCGRRNTTVLLPTFEDSGRPGEFEDAFVVARCRDVNVQNIPLDRRSTSNGMFDFALMAWVTEEEFVQLQTDDMQRRLASCWSEYQVPETSMVQALMNSVPERLHRI